MKILRPLHASMPSAIWFIVIGALASIMHYVVAVALESFTALAPSHANIVGFLMAFPLSYVGHKTYSFPQHTTSSHQSLVRFLMIAVLGFLANQSLVIFCLQTFNWPFWVVLAGVMIVVAASTYLLSRFWAFRAR